MSEFHVETVKIGPLEKHPNADNLSITRVHGGYPCIVRTDEWKEGDIGVYVPVDSLVPLDHPAFDWLKHPRIRAKKIRGVFSMGLLVKTEHTKPGVDVRDELGIEKYETAVEKHDRVFQPIKRKPTYGTHLEEWCLTVFGALSLVVLLLGAPWWSSLIVGAFAVLVYFAVSHYNKPLKRPNVPVYDIEGFRKFSKLFQPGELVQLTEKIHGCNARYMHDGKRLHIGSRTQWRNDGIWKDIAFLYGLEEKLRKHPNVVLFGEIYGRGVQDLDYNGVIRFTAFDAMYLNSREFMNANEFRAFCFDLGIPTETQCPIGRKQLKLVGQNYLLRNE